MIKFRAIYTRCMYKAQRPYKFQLKTSLISLFFKGIFSLFLKSSALSIMTFILHFPFSLAMEGADVSDRRIPEIERFLFRGRLKHCSHPFDLGKPRVDMKTVELSARQGQTPADFLGLLDVPLDRLDQPLNAGQRARLQRLQNEGIEQYFIDGFPENLIYLSILNQAPLAPAPRPALPGNKRGLSFHFVNTSSATLSVASLERVRQTFEQLGGNEGDWHGKRKPWMDSECIRTLFDIPC